MLISYFDHIEKPYSPTDADINDVLQGIRTGRWSALINKLREIIAQDGTKRSPGAEAFKKSLPLITPGGTFAKRSNDGLVKASGLAPIDLDDMTPAELDKYRQKILVLPFVYSYFISCSGTGLCVIVKIPEAENDTEYKKTFYQLEVLFTHILKIPIDSAPDIARGRNVSYDPDIYINPDAQVFKPDDYPALIEYLVKEKERQERERREAQERLEKLKESKGVEFGQFTTDEQIEFAEGLVQRSLSFTKGYRYNYIVKLAVFCNKLGVSESELELYVSQVYPEFYNNKMEIGSAIKGPYKRYKSQEGTWIKEKIIKTGNDPALAAKVSPRTRPKRVSNDKNQPTPTGKLKIDFRTWDDYQALIKKLGLEPSPDFAQGHNNGVQVSYIDLKGNPQTVKGKTDQRVPAIRETGKVSQKVNAVYIPPGLRERYQGGEVFPYVILIEDELNAYILDQLGLNAIGINRPDGFIPRKGKRQPNRLINSIVRRSDETKVFYALPGSAWSLPQILQDSPRPYLETAANERAKSWLNILTVLEESFTANKVYLLHESPDDSSQSLDWFVTHQTTQAEKAEPDQDPDRDKRLEAIDTRLAELMDLAPDLQEDLESWLKRKDQKKSYKRGLKKAEGLIEKLETERSDLQTELEELKRTDAGAGIRISREKTESALKQLDPLKGQKITSISGRNPRYFAELLKVRDPGQFVDFHGVDELGDLFKFDGYLYKIDRDGQVTKKENVIDSRRIRKDGGVYWAQGLKGEQRITNFVITPWLKVLGDKPYVLCEIENTIGERKEFIVTDAHIFNADAFSRKVFGQGRFSYTGTTLQLKLLIEELFKEVKQAVMLEDLGLQTIGSGDSQEKVYVWGNGFTLGSGEFIEADEAGIIKRGGTYYYFPAFSSYKLGADHNQQFELNRLMRYEDGETELEGWVSQLIKVNGDKGHTSFVYALASLFRDVLYGYFQRFPLLYYQGIPGTGKSTLLDSIGRLWGQKIRTANLEQGNTNSALTSIPTSVSNGLITCNEFNIETLDPKLAKLIKGWYDGEGRLKRLGPNDNRVTSNHITTGVILAGQDAIYKHKSIMDRAIIEEFHKTQLTTENDKAKAAIRDLEANGLTHLTGQFFSYREVIEENLKDSANALLAELKAKTAQPGIDHRFFENWTIILTPLLTLLDKGLIEYPWSRKKIIDYAIERIKYSSEKSQSQGILEIFWTFIGSEYGRTNSGLDDRYVYLMESKNRLHIHYRNTFGLFRSWMRTRGFTHIQNTEYGDFRYQLKKHPAFIAELQTQVGWQRDANGRLAKVPDGQGGEKLIPNRGLCLMYKYEDLNLDLNQTVFGDEADQGNVPQGEEITAGALVGADDNGDVPF